MQPQTKTFEQAEAGSPEKAEEKAPEKGEEGLSPRQREILENALELLVSGGEKALTTANIAKVSNCSKESLYKWFGDRQGLLAAMMAYQGSKVGAAVGDETLETEAAFKHFLVQFATELLTVLSGDMSIALNRLAIGQASADNSELGLRLIENGRGVIRAKGIAFLNAAKAKDYLNFDKAEDAYRTLYGLIVSDFHVRILLGEKRVGEKRDRHVENLKREAARAVSQFYVLYSPLKGA